LGNFHHKLNKEITIKKIISTKEQTYYKTEIGKNGIHSHKERDAFKKKKRGSLTLCVMFQELISKEPKC